VRFHAFPFVLISRFLSLCPDRWHFGPDLIQHITSLHQIILACILPQILTLFEIYQCRVYHYGNHRHILPPHSLRVRVLMPAYPEILGLFCAGLLSRYQRFWYYYVHRKCDDGSCATAFAASDYTGAEEGAVAAEDCFGGITYGRVFVSSLPYQTPPKIWGGNSLFV